MQVAEKEKDTDSQIRYLDAILAISPEDRYSRAQRAMLFISWEKGPSTLRYQFLT